MSYSAPELPAGQGGSEDSTPARSDRNVWTMPGPRDTKPAGYDPVEFVLATLQAKGCEPKPAGPDRWKARCSAHDDHRPSLDIARGDDGRVLLICRAGCDNKAIVAALKIEMSDLFPAGETLPPASSNGHKPKLAVVARPVIVATYDYRDANGMLRYQVVRMSDKSFPQRRPDGKGGWLNNVEGVEKLPYSLPELLAAAPSEPVFVVEGEKDVQTLRQLGLVATCNSGGAGKWFSRLAEYLRDRVVVVLRDNDPAGWKHVFGPKKGNYCGVLPSLHGVAKSLKYVELPDLPEHGDVSDFLKSHSKDDLLALVDGAAEWTPSAEPVAAADPDPRPFIDLTTDLHLTVEASIGAISAHPDVYQRVKELTLVVRYQPAGCEAGLRRAADTPLIAPLAIPTARTMLSRVARFRRYDKRNKEWEPVVPPRDIAESVIRERNYPAAQELVGIIEAPTLRPDGSLLDTPGYDRQTGLLYLPNAEYPAIPDRPTETMVKAAVRDLLYLVTDFPFAKEHDKSAWLASVLTLIARGGIDGPIPAYLISANVAGSGKTHLASLAGLLASGRAPAMDGYADNDEEMSKVLTTVALSGDRYLVLDNAPNGSAVGSPALDRAITAHRSFRGRILGSNAMSPDVPWAAMITITGNNLSTRDDSLRRFVPIFLEYPEANPEKRDPKDYEVYKDHGMDLQTYVVRNRARLVSAALTILRGYLTSGAEPAKLPSMDFPAWDALIRQAVYHATGHDPCGSRDTLAAEDETMGERVRLVNGWQALCVAAGKPEGLTVEEAMVQLAKFEMDLDHRPLVETFAYWAKGGRRVPSGKDLGYLLRKNKNAATPCGRLCNEAAGGRVFRWYVKP